MKKTLISIAIKLLSKRDYSCHELSKKLLTFCENRSEIDYTIALLKEKKFLSDDYFSERLVAKYISNYGSNFIFLKMKSYGLDIEIIEKNIFAVKETDFDRAVLLCEKKFGGYSNQEVSYSKKARFLASRGFPSDIVYKVLNES
ncbi:MAG: RecX family transcriptional regulator [Candidatus Kinetoplastibacterium crithidii]|nr:MAG: RecX family transcriptional regulator [Candidatus Kinetoplastibacterium crithidii]